MSDSETSPAPVPFTYQGRSLMAVLTDAPDSWTVTAFEGDERFPGLNPVVEPFDEHGLTSRTADRPATPRAFMRQVVEAWED